MTNQLGEGYDPDGNDVLTTTRREECPVSATEKPTETQVDDAVALATDARSSSYSPYSKFPMGAAVADAAGELIAGALVENVSLGLAMCAERVALFNAVVRGLEPKLLVLCSSRTEGELTFPCGACLQVALELGGPELQVVAVDPDGARDSASVRDLLPRSPHRFTPKTAPADS